MYDLVSAKLNLCRASSFVPDLCDHMDERAFEDVGEFTEGWTDKVNMKRLQHKVEQLVDYEFSVAGAQPNFGFMEDEQEIKVKVIKVDGWDTDTEYEVIEGEER